MNQPPLATIRRISSRRNIFLERHANHRRPRATANCSKGPCLQAVGAAFVVMPMSKSPVMLTESIRLWSMTARATGAGNDCPTCDARMHSAL